MRLRSIVDVQIAPAGDRVAYVVSTPNLEQNEHEAALFVVPARGGAARRLGETVHIFNVPSPRPQLRWSPDSTRVSVLGIAAGGPRFSDRRNRRRRAEQVTKAPEGVLAYEWSPDAQSIAFITLDAMPPDEARQRTTDRSSCRPARPTDLRAWPCSASINRRRCGC